ncbi:MAG: hypothetical protein BWZ10_02767 [candidate division BRC1 bacterium ADurb.BinA364]|nr:MAG: hypothetical protein BWZ10_02767 [candidate division BRC1 bacterium ADurb.BinA364]
MIRAMSVKYTGWPSRTATTRLSISSGEVNSAGTFRLYFASPMSMLPPGVLMLLAAMVCTISAMVSP